MLPVSEKYGVDASVLWKYLVSGLNFDVIVNRNSLQLWETMFHEVEKQILSVNGSYTYMDLYDEISPSLTDFIPYHVPLCAFTSNMNRTLCPAEFFKRHITIHGTCFTFNHEDLPDEMFTVDTSLAGGGLQMIMFTTQDDLSGEIYSDGLYVHVLYGE